MKVPDIEKASVSDEGRPDDGNADDIGSDERTAIKGAWTYVLNSLRYRVDYKTDQNGYVPIVSHTVPVSIEDKSDELADFSP